MASTSINSKPVPRLGEDLLNREFTLIDLSRQLFTGMPVWQAHQKPFIFTNQTHDEFKETWSTCRGFETRNLLINEHTGTHTDALFEIDPHGATIDHMPLPYFYGEGLCLDLTDVRYPKYITVPDLEKALSASGRKIPRGGHVLLYTGHGERTYPKKEYLKEYAGLDRDATAWLAEHGAINIGVDSSNVDHSDDWDFPAHVTCAEYGITNTEGLTNLHLLLGHSFMYFGLPMNIREGTGSPIRAVAWVRDEQ